MRPILSGRFQLADDGTESDSEDIAVTSIWHFGSRRQAHRWARNMPGMIDRGPSRDRRRASGLVRRMAVIALAVILMASTGCGGESSEEPPDESQTTVFEATTTVAAATTGGGAEPSVPAGFPVPIPEGGTVTSAFPTEVQVGFAESDFEAIVAFYRDYSDGLDGLENELFEGGFEWQIVTEQGGQIVITVTPEDGGTVVFIRLL
jgi:hypothetical protein